MQENNRKTVLRINFTQAIVKKRLDAESSGELQESKFEFRRKELHAAVHSFSHISELRGRERHLKINFQQIFDKISVNWDIDGINPAVGSFWVKWSWKQK